MEAVLLLGELKSLYMVIVTELTLFGPHFLNKYRWKNMIKRPWMQISREIWDYGANTRKSVVTAIQTLLRESLLAQLHTQQQWVSLVNKWRGWGYAWFLLEYHILLHLFKCDMQGEYFGSPCWMLVCSNRWVVHVHRCIFRNTRVQTSKCLS